MSPVRGSCQANRACVLLYASSKCWRMLSCAMTNVALAGTWLLLDGEEVPYERIYAEVHPGLCSVVVAPQAL